MPVTVAATGQGASGHVSSRHLLQRIERRRVEYEDTGWNGRAVRSDRGSLREQTLRDVRGRARHVEAVDVDGEDPGDRMTDRVDLGVEDGLSELARLERVSAAQRRLDARQDCRRLVRGIDGDLQREAE